jgi:two-component system, OmpR family, phosphate regulon sensor histidine kinase PhoR
MKQYRLRLFILASSIALVGVLVIQVNWIFRTAEMKEALFNEKANLVLAKTTEALGSDQATCQKIEQCQPADGQSDSPLQLGKAELHKIDSLFGHYMRFYNVEIQYSFSVVKPSSDFEPPWKGSRFNKPLDAFIQTSGVQLNLVFPDKNQYLLAEMGVPFFTSVFLILVVLVMLWKTVHALYKEKEISERTTDFLNNMTHEFKTPITNISLAGKLMTKDSNLKQEEKIRQYSGIILEENEKLRLQVEQVLSISALERGEIPIQKEHLDFHALLNESLARIQIQLDHSKGWLRTAMDAKNTLIDGDRTHLSNALCNLFDNAIKYAGPNPSMKVSTHNEGSDLVIIVSDQGIGIEKGYHKKVFEKYFRVPTGDVHNVKGFGLGLAYVKQILDGHGGSVSLQSEPGQGTTFTLRLPYVNASV